MAKDVESSNYIFLSLILNANPKVSRGDRLVRADGEFSKLKLFLFAIQHAGVYQAEIWMRPKFLAIVIHGLLYFYAQGCAWVIVKQQHSSVHGTSFRIVKFLIEQYC